MARREQNNSGGNEEQVAQRAREAGAALREARQGRGEDLYDIAEYLRIRPAYLFALEEGDLDAMPGRPYALGFLRTYSDYLGFDGQELVADVKALMNPSAAAARPQHGQAKISKGAAAPPPAAREPSPAPVGAQTPGASFGEVRASSGASSGGRAPVAPRGGASTFQPRGHALPGSAKEHGAEKGGRFSGVLPLVLLLALVGALGYGGYVLAQNGSVPSLARLAQLPGELGEYASQVFEEDPEGAPGEGPVGDAAPAGTEGAGPGVERLEAEDAFGGAPDSPAGSDGTVVAAADGGGEQATPPGERPDGGQAGLLVEGLSDLGPRLEARPAEEPALAGLDDDSESVPAQTFGEGGGRVSLVAIAPSWVQVKSEGMDYVRTRTLEAGDRFDLPPRDDLALWTGNAGGLQVVVDGEPLGPLGDPGRVVRDVSLAPEALQRRYR